MADAAERYQIELGPQPDNELHSASSTDRDRLGEQERTPRPRRAGASLMRGGPDRVTPSIGSHAGATLLVIAGLMIAPAWSAMSSPADDQDACRIGAVSPEGYRAIAAEIAALPPVDWNAALDAKYQSEGVAAALRQRLERLLAGRTNADEQIAAMHAMMRSVGAELVYAQRTEPFRIASYRYRLDVNRIGLTRLLSRWAEIVIRFEQAPSADGGPELERVVALMPEMLDPGRPGWKKPAQEQLCPPAPADAPTFQERLDKYNQHG